jgi:hypothetical protein
MRATIQSENPLMSPSLTPTGVDVAEPVVATVGVVSTTGVLVGVVGFGKMTAVGAEDKEGVS